MTIPPQLASATEARHTFVERLTTLFLELEGEAQANPAFALPACIASTFQAAQQAHAAWHQAVNALLTDEPRRSELSPYPSQAQVYRRLIRLANDLTRRWLHLADCQQSPEISTQMAVLDRKLAQIEAELRTLQEGQEGAETLPVSCPTTLCM
ncbi:MAG TPA: hypothetical protein VH599_01610 [Ktedonobacterales bacterium]